MVSLAKITRLRRRNERMGIGLPGNNDRILDVARSFKESVDAPVLDGIAVYLHGYARSTLDLDLYTLDRRLTDEQLRSAGAKWDDKNREHVKNGVRIHTVTPDGARHEVRKTSIIDGIRVVSLADLIAIKLRCGLGNFGRAKDIADVEELIRTIGLDKSFAAKLPTDLRTSYKKFVDKVRMNEKRRGERRF